MPLVSIILTVKNPLSQFDACLQGIARQMLRDFEVLCVCNGSCTQAIEQLESLAMTDSRFCVYVSDVFGQSFTWLDALNHSSGKYVCLIDDDTVLAPTMLERLTSLAERLDLDVAFCNGREAESESDELRRDLGSVIRSELLPLHEAFSADEVAQQLFEAVPQHSWNRLYRRDFLMDSACLNRLADSAASEALALTAIATARRIDYVSSALVTHGATPHTPADSVIGGLLKAKEHLKHQGAYLQHERAFVNYAASLLLSLRDSLPADRQIGLSSKVKEACAELGITDRERSFFYRSSTYDQITELLSWEEPSVTVLMPSLNVAPYIRQAVESVLNQTLKTIEVLCIDAGSTDGTLEILREYEMADPRVRVIFSDRRSYGYQMNLGLAAARGEFIGIVETDDFADPEMFETLYRKAKLHDAQVVKGNYYDYQTRPVEKSVFHRSYYRLPYDRLLSDAQRIEIVRRIPCIWSGIYETRMLRDNGIGFLETPGASYQDTSFVLKVWVTVERAVLDEHAFLHYRNDNEASSVRQSDKVYYVNGEFASAYEYCLARHGSKSGFTKSLRCRQAVAYLWNFNRIADEFKSEYLERLRDEFVVARDAGELERKYFWPKEWDAVHRILESPSDYSASLQSGKNVQEEPDRPVLSVIVNLCGCDERTSRCLESLFSQDLSRAEVILVDNGQSATVSAQLDKHAAEIGDAVLVRSEAAPFGRLLGEATTRVHGTWMLFLDGNSALEIDAMKGLVDFLTTCSSDVVLLQHDEFDVAKGELVARGVGAEVGQRHSLETINAQTDARSILQIADAHVANKVFRKSFVEAEQLSFTDDALNGDVVFCELGLLRAASVEVNPATLVDALVGEGGSRDAMLKLRPGTAADAWRELIEETGRQGLLASHIETIACAAAEQLAGDMETVRDCCDARTGLCAAIAGCDALLSMVDGQERPLCLSEAVYNHMHGAIQAVAFADGSGVKASLKKPAAAIAAVRDALVIAGKHDDDAKPLTELVTDAVNAVCEAGGAAEFLWWCLPAQEQLALDLLVGARVFGQKDLDEAATREKSMRAEIDVTQRGLQTMERELAATKRKLAATEKKAVEDVRSAEETVRASRSYRLGNALGAPLRAARSMRDMLRGE